MNLDINIKLSFAGRSYPCMRPIVGHNLRPYDLCFQLMQVISQDVRVVIVCHYVFKSRGSALSTSSLYDVCSRGIAITSQPIDINFRFGPDLVQAGLAYIWRRKCLQLSIRPTKWTQVMLLQSYKNEEQTIIFKHSDISLVYVMLTIRRFFDKQETIAISKTRLHVQNLNLNFRSWCIYQLRPIQYCKPLLNSIVLHFSLLLRVTHLAFSQLNLLRMANDTYFLNRHVLYRNICFSV